MKFPSLSLVIDISFAKNSPLFEGIKNVKKLPEAVFAVDINHDKIAIAEAKKTGIKVIGLADTNSDPQNLDYLIPSNDDSIKAIALMTSLMAEAINEGKSNPVVKEIVPDAK